MAAIIAFGGLYFVVTTFGRYTAAATTIRYVAPSGNDAFTTFSNPCIDVNSPCLSLQHAVDMAESGDEIRLAAGTYAAVSVRQSITQVVYITKTITIVGGYPAGFGQAPNSQQFQTVLDAAGLGRVFVIEQVEGVTIQGVTVMNGDASLLPSSSGGGIYALHSDVTLIQVGLISNTAEFGGGFYGLNGRVTLRGSDIASNTARYGGALYARQLVIALTNNEFHHNTAALGGGAIRTYASNAIIQDNDIANNAAGLHGAGVYVTRGQLTLTGNQLYGNHIANVEQGWGGGLHLIGVTAHVEANQFTNNTAAYGGGLRLLDSNATVARNIVRDNMALYGGGLALQGATKAELHNNVIIDNEAAEQGAGVYIHEADTKFKHATLARNGNSGEAIVVDGFGSRFYMQNSILADHRVGVVKVQKSSQVLLESNLWDGNVTNTVGSVANIVALTGNAAFAADGYHLLSGSAAINAAPNSGIVEDIDGYGRPYYEGYDLGADEWSTLIVEKTASQTFVEPNDRLTYTIRLENSTGLPISAILTDTLPGEVTIFAPPLVSRGNWQVNDTQLNWKGTIPSARAVTIEWPVQVIPTLEKGQLIINKALVRDNVGRFETAPAISFWPVMIYLPVLQR